MPRTPALRSALPFRHVAALLLLAGLGIVGYTAFLRLESRPEERDDDAPRRPSEADWLRRTFPYFTADPAAYRTAYLDALSLRQAAKTATFGAWEPVGPTNVGGRMIDVAFDPLHPDTVYAAAATGGVFKSSDGGATWTPTFDDQPVLTIGDIAVDPVRPNVLYVGTGEANGGHNNFAGSGVYRSADGGATWTYAGLAETTSIGRILVHPTDPDRVYVAAVGSYFAGHPERGVFRSTDGGDTWTHVFYVDDTTGAVDLVMRPDDPDILLVAAWQRERRPDGAFLSGPNSGIYRSLDGGDTWTRLGAAQGLPDGPAGRIGLGLCPSAPDVVYALYTDGFTYQGFYRSDDGGDTWADAGPTNSLSNGFGTFSWYFGQVRCHPEDPDHVFVMDVRLMQSTDGGRTWSTQTGTHVDHHALAFHPDDPSIVLNGNDGGLARSTDSGRTWTRVPDLPVTQFYEIAVDPSNPARFYGGTQDNGTLRSEGTDAWTQILGGDGFYVLVDPDHPSVVYAEAQNGALVKFSGGQTLPATNGISPNDPRNWSTPVVMDPRKPRVLYYGTHRVYRTEDGAASWVPISDDLTKRLGYALIGTITTIAVAPTSSSVLYVGTDDGNVWVSDDYGATWRDVTAPPLPFRWVTRLVVDPYDANVAYATFSGLRWRDPESHVFRTTNRGATWTDLSANLPDAPVNAFAVDPRNPDYLYLGSDVGAFVSVNGGASWATLGTGLPAVPVYDLKIYEDASRRFLVAGTHGRSMYTLDLSRVPAPTPTGVAGAAPAPPAVTLEPAYPNPVAEEATLVYHLAEPADVRLDVFDLLGRRVTTLAAGPAPPGTHTARWDAAGRAPGLYAARLTATTASGLTRRTVTLTKR